MSVSSPAETAINPASSKNPKELPMEYAVELNRLIGMEMEGAVG